MSIADSEAKIKWMRDNSKRYVVKVMLNTESDILEKLESVPNKGGYIKELIRRDIQQKK